MSKEKLMILEMLKDGKITEEEALKLLEALGEDKQEGIGNFFSSMIEQDIVKKIGATVEKVLKKTNETIQNIDLEDVDFHSTIKDLTKYRSTIEKTYSIDLAEGSVPSLCVNGYNGAISLMPWDEKHIEVRADIYYNDKFVNGDFEFVNLKREENEVLIETSQASMGYDSVEINMQIMLPRLKFESIRVENLLGKCELNLIETEKLDVNINSGKIVLNSVAADFAKVNGANSKVELIDLNGKKAEINSSNGKIAIDGLFVVDAKLSTSNGAIYVSDVNKLCKRLDARTANGSIKIDLGNYQRPVRAQFDNINRFSTRVRFAENFSSLIQADSYVTASTVDFKEGEEGNLEITGTTMNGSIIVE